MKKNILIVSFCIIFPLIISAQTENQEQVKLIIRNAPSFTLEGSINYDYGVYELSGNYNGDFNSQEFIEGKNFGVRHGIGGIITAKVPMHKKGHLRGSFSISYNNFSSKYSKALENLSEADFVKYNVFSWILGIENSFTPTYKFKTYVGIGLIGSLINGTARITTEESSNNLTILPAFRLGVTLNSGLEYMLTNKMGLNCGIRFTHANLWLKESKPSDNPEEIYLNDKKVTTNQSYSGFKQFAWGSFFAGINYYFGIAQKEYIYPKHN
ncbi:MAG TPA: hypothetical protein VGK25_12680 [Ignavibacteria bacterium]|jgi:opacity protein-like surface antigen